MNKDISINKFKTIKIPIIDFNQVEREANDIVNTDNVNHPSHYTDGNIEVIDFIEDKKLNYHRGNVVKYVCRAGKKNNEIEDLQKASWYLNREIERLKASGEALDR